MEIWIPIKSYEELYHVSNTGYIKAISTSKRCKERILKPGKKSSGHRYVNLCKNGISKSTSVHRLVGQAFMGIDIIDRKVCILHIDDNPSNNSVDNLFIGTQKDNILDMDMKGRRVNSKNFGENHGMATLKNEQVLEIRKKYNGKYGHQTLLAKEYNTSLYTINRIVLDKSWKNIL